MSTPLSPPEPAVVDASAARPQTAATDAGPGQEPEPIPAMQQVLDNPFLLLFIGVTVPTVFYIIWGIMEIVSIPMAR